MATVLTSVFGVLTLAAWVYFEAQSRLWASKSAAAPLGYRLEEPHSPCFLTPARTVSQLAGRVMPGVRGCRGV